jgi:ribulose-phosphate 3-epimerase
MVKIAPSILAADFFNLEKEIKMMKEANTDYIHFDVMDGMFVSNITFGMPVLASLKRKTDIPFDVHLMIDKPERYIKDFSDAGADIITFHVEATAHVSRCIQLIKKCGKKAGVALNPHTPIDSIKHVLKEIDMVLLMSVNPGYGGQKMIMDVLDKGKALRKLADDMNLDFEIEIDGGVTPENAKSVASYGFDVLVAGSAIFAAKDKKLVIKQIKGE